ncbi:MAG: MEDS domain-containing protein [Thermoanaerobacterales bacterium]|nr:MEDS domain-containing protein [Thermoanaerobacterales bacterium]
MKDPATLSNAPPLWAGDHVCILHQGIRERIMLLLSLLRDGLAGGMKCVYVVDDYQTVFLIWELCRGLLKEMEGLRPGQLVFASWEDFFPGGASFNPDESVTMLAVRESQALKEGFAGLRVAVEMTWMIGAGVPLDRIVDYEKILNAYCSQSRCMVLCAYDLLRFPPVTTVNALTVHPLVLLDGALCRNLYYISNPDLRLDPLASAAILRHYLEQLRECAPYLALVHKKGPGGTG